MFSCKERDIIDNYKLFNISIKSLKKNIKISDIIKNIFISI